MSDNEARLLKVPARTPWNKGELIGAKPPLRPKHVRSIMPSGAITLLRHLEARRSIGSTSVGRRNALRLLRATSCAREDRLRESAPPRHSVPTNSAPNDASVVRSARMIGSPLIEPDVARRRPVGRVAVDIVVVVAVQARRIEGAPPSGVCRYRRLCHADDGG